MKTLKFLIIAVILLIGASLFASEKPGAKIVTQEYSYAQPTDFGAGIFDLQKFVQGGNLIDYTIPFAEEIPHKAGPIYIFGFPDVDSLTGWPQYTPEIDIGLILGDKIFYRYYTNAPAADSFLVSVWGRFEAKPNTALYDSLGYFYVAGASSQAVTAGATDSLAMKIPGYQQIRLKILPYWASVAPYNSLSNRYVYIQFMSRGTTRINEVESYIRQVPKGY